MTENRANRGKINDEILTCIGVKDYEDKTITIIEPHEALGIEFYTNLNFPKGVTHRCDDCRIILKASKRKYTGF